MNSEEDEFRRIEAEAKRRAAQEPSMTDRKVMQQALECIERCNAHGWILADYEDEVYASIDALKAALAQPEQKPVSHSVIAGALFDFMGWLTSRKERLALSRVDDASPAVDAITDFAKMRGLSLDDARVLDWHTTPPAAQRPWVGLTEFQFAEIYNAWNDTNGSTPWGLNQALEAKLRKLNT